MKSDGRHRCGIADDIIALGQNRGIVQHSFNDAIKLTCEGGATREGFTGFLAVEVKDKLMADVGGNGVDQRQGAIGACYFGKGAALSMGRVHIGNDVANYARGKGKLRLCTSVDAFASHDLAGLRYHRFFTSKIVRLKQTEKQS